MDLITGIIVVALLLAAAAYYEMLPLKLNIETSGFRAGEKYGRFGGSRRRDGFESSHTLLSNPIFYGNSLAKSPAVKSMHDIETDQDSFRKNVPHGLKDKLRHTNMRWQSDSQVNDSLEDYNHMTRKREGMIAATNSTDQIVFDGDAEKQSYYNYALATDSNYINKLMNTNIKIPEEVVTPNLNDFAVAGDTCKSVSGAVLTLTDYSPAFNDVQYGTGKGYISI